MNGRTLLTTWGDRAQSINDYANRTWSGLVADYYAERWRMFLDAAVGAVEAGRKFDEEAIFNAMADFEKEFAGSTKPLTQTLAGDVCEIVRAGIQAVDAGQTEAARSLGLNSRQAMIHIVLPQAVKNILPALCNEFVAIVKETSLASTFFIGELMTQFKTINGITFRVLEPLTIVGIIYFLVTFVMSKLIALLERRMNASER